MVLEPGALPRREIMLDAVELLLLWTLRPLLLVCSYKSCFHGELVSLRPCWWTKRKVGIKGIKVQWDAGWQVGSATIVLLSPMNQGKIRTYNGRFTVSAASARRSISYGSWSLVDSLWSLAIPRRLLLLFLILSILHYNIIEWAVNGVHD